jgi:glutaconate CoA-transferase subunit B
VWVWQIPVTGTGQITTQDYRTLGMILQSGHVDVGFLGGLQIDRYGNINSTLTKTENGFRHFTGSGGAADIASYAKKIYVIMKHEKRKL